MLTLDAIIQTTKHQAAFGEGKHQFDKGYERIVSVPRDKKAKPKAPNEE